jgi:hypothetical protein
LNVENSVFSECCHSISDGLVLDVGDYDWHEVGLGVELFYSVQHLQFVLLAVQYHEDSRCSRVLFEILEEVVSHIWQIYALTVEVSELFHFQSSFFGDAVSDTLTTEENVPVTFNLSCNFDGLLVNAIESFFHVS